MEVAISLWTSVLSVGWILVDVFCRGVVWMMNLTTMIGRRCAGTVVSIELERLPC